MSSTTFAPTTRPWLLLALVMLALAPRSVQASRSQVSGAASPGAIRLGVARDAVAHVLNYPNIAVTWPQTFDPANVTDTASFQVLSMLYSNLVKFDTQNRIVPDLAASWTVSPDGKTYTFHLRRDARFADGTAVTADDVIYSLDRALNPRALGGKAPSPVAATYLGHIVGASTYTGRGDVAGLKKIDRLTVQMTIDSPIAFFLQTLAYFTGDILKKGTPIGGLVTRNPLLYQVSSGPWKIATFRKNSSLTFVPNPWYYGYRRMKLREVQMPFVGSYDTAYQGYESGQYAMADVQSSRLASAASLPDFHRGLVLATAYIIYNVAKPPFNDKNLRLATSYAVNQDTIDGKLLHGAAQPLYSMVPQGIPGFDARGKSFVPHYDPARARMYLARAKREMGHAFPSSVTLKYVNFSSDNIKVFTELQYEWKQIGLNVKMQGISFNTYLGFIAKPTTSLTYTSSEPWFQGSWLDDYPDAADFTTVLLAANSAYNVGDYHNARFETLITDALTVRGPERPGLYIQASRIALNDAAWTMLGQLTTSWRWRPSISGMTLWSGAGYPVPIDNDWTAVDVQ